MVILPLPLASRAATDTTSHTWSVTVVASGTLNAVFRNDQGSGTLTLDVADRRGTAAGWTILVTARGQQESSLIPGSVICWDGNEAVGRMATHALLPVTTRPMTFWQTSPGAGDGLYSLPSTMRMDHVGAREDTPQTTFILDLRGNAP